MLKDEFELIDEIREYIKKKIEESKKEQPKQIYPSNTSIRNYSFLLV